MSNQVYGGPEMQAYTAQREREFAERQSEADKPQAKAFNVLELADQFNAPKVAPREVRYAAVMKYDQRIRETGSSDNPSAASPSILAMTMRDEFAAYLRGWTDGAGARATRPEFTSHATFAAPYSEGYSDGRKARNMAHLAASEKYGCKVSVLRTPEKIGDDNEEADSMA